jgi:DNA-directed RNA polymerase subunit RPC12/RpoP
MKLRRDLRVWCDDCGHGAMHSPVYFAMFGNLPYDTTTWELVQKLKCPKCGSRRVGIAPKA